MKVVRVGIQPTLGPPQWRVFIADALTVGRDYGCEVRLDDPAVSAFHARVKIEPAEITVTDLSSTNGTFLGASSVDRATISPSPIADQSGNPAGGQAMVIGGYQLHFQVGELAKAPAEEIDDMLWALAQGPPQLELQEAARAWARLRPERPDAARGLALAHLRAGKADEAEQAVQKSLTADPHHPRSKMVAALIDEAQGRLEQAALVLEDLLAGGRGPEAAKGALGRVRRKREVYAKIKGLVSMEEGSTPEAPDQEAVLSAGPFKLRFGARGHGDLVLGAHAALAQAADRLEDLLGFAPSEIEVIFGHDAGQEDWAAACYDGTIRINAGAANGDPYFLYVALTHEYVHLAVDRLAHGAAPAWLNEGLAQFITQNPTPADMEALVRALAADALLPIAALEQDFTRLEERALVDLAYAQSYSLVQYLVQRIGWPGVRRLLAGLGRSKETDDPSGSALAPWGLDLGSLEQDWLHWLK